MPTEPPNSSSGKPLHFSAQETLFEALVGATRRFGRNTPGQWEDMKPGSYSYGDLLKMTLALGRLAAKVTSEGEHVGVLMPNIAATICLAIGLSAFKRIPCMLNYTAGSEGMQNACHTATIRTVIASREFILKAGLKETVAGLKGIEIVWLEELRPRFGLRDKLWLMGFALWFPLRALPPGAPDDPATVLFTSGSEGKPKGVVLSHRALLSNVAQILQQVPIGPSDKLLTALPVFHSFALTGGALMPLVCGARLMLYTSPLHYKVIPELVRDKGCTVLFGTSTFLYQYARNAAPEAFKTLRVVVAGAEKLSEATRAIWQEKFGIGLIEGYGCTETAPVLAANTPADNRAGSVGQLVAGVEARLVPVDGIPEGGELHVRGPNLMSGYYRYDNPAVLEPPASELGPGWHRTGDVVDIDSDGFIRIKARLKRFAKVAGEMVSLEVVEAIANAASGNGAHAATAIPDPGRGEIILLFTTDSDLTREQLAAAAIGLGYPEIAIPRKIQRVPDLPLLGTGKVDYVTLQASIVSA